MRNLIISRRKSFVACLMKVKVYIENYASGDKMINNIPCTKIGEIKNGETKTFQIAEHAAKVFVIVDDLSKNYCNDFYEIPEGSDDIFLSGENQFNPTNGNAFRFDGVSSEAVMQNRRKGSKKGLVVLIITIIICSIIGFLIGFGSFSFNTAKSQPKTFSCDGMQITLTDKFSEENFENFTVCYASNDIAIYALKEDFNLIKESENYSIEEYGQLVLKNNGNPASGLKNDNGITYFDYTFNNPNNNVTYYYLTTLYKADDSFWIISFCTIEDNSETYKQQFFDWAKTVEFANNET